MKVLLNTSSNKGKVTSTAQQRDNKPSIDYGSKNKPQTLRCGADWGVGWRTRAEGFKIQATWRRFPHSWTAFPMRDLRSLGASRQ